MSDTTNVLPSSARESAASATPASLHESGPAAATSSADTLTTASVLAADSGSERAANGDAAAAAAAAASVTRRRRQGTGLSAMLLPELQAMAQSMGIQGVGRLRKGQLIAAIQNLQNESSGGSAAPASAGAQPVATPSLSLIHI